jgi:hypothetical protein
MYDAMMTLQGCSAIEQSATTSTPEELIKCPTYSR